MSATESRDFRISNNMIFHLVFSQAGTVAKSLGELVMNSQDAGAVRFEMTIDPSGFTAQDNGRGFQSRAEIESWFEELGFDHSDDLHQEDGRFSRFGLGRAQCMAFAATQWRTHTFLMDVDIKARGISYDLAVDQPYVEGCRVEGQWYEPMSFADLKTTLRELEELIAYVDIDVIVNGNKINRTKTKWDYETDTVYVRRKERGDLAVYNKGVLVRTYPSYQFGSGVVVSKVPFTLNIARNDILQSSCPVWKEVRAFLREDAVNTNKKKRRLNDDERQMLIDQLISGDITAEDVRDSPLIEDVTGRKWKLEKLWQGPITVHTNGAKLAADRIQQSKQAFVLAKSVMESFSADTPEDLVALLEQIVRTRRWGAHLTLRYVPIEDLLESHNDEYLLLKPKELTKVERVTLSALNSGFRDLQHCVNLTLHGRGHCGRYRTLYVGASDHAHGWTDGHSFVAINRDFLREHARDGSRGFIAMFNLLVHELCHEANTATSHEHGAEFYEAFHDVMLGEHHSAYGTALRKALTRFVSYSEREGLKLSRNETRDIDREVAIDRAVFEDEAFLDMTREDEAQKIA